MKTFNLLLIFSLLSLSINIAANPFPGKKAFNKKTHSCKAAAYFWPLNKDSGNRKYVDGYFVGMKTIDGFEHTRFLPTSSFSEKKVVTHHFKFYLNHCLYSSASIKTDLYEVGDPIIMAEQEIKKSMNYKHYRLSSWKNPKLPKDRTCLCLSQAEKDKSVVANMHKKYMESLRQIEADIRHDQAKITSIQLDSILNRINSLQLLLSNYEASDSGKESIEKELVSLKKQVDNIQKELSKLITENNS